MKHNELDRWKAAGLIASAVIVLVIPVYAVKENLRRNRTERSQHSATTFVGREKCVSCHQEAYRKWLGSDHDRALSVADDAAVLGDFNDAVFETVEADNSNYSIGLQQLDSLWQSFSQCFQLAVDG